MPGIWTITYGGVEKSCAAWGLTARPRIGTRDRQPTSFSFRMAGAAPESGVPFPFKAEVILKQNRTFGGGVWSGSGYIFVGYQTTQPADVDGHSQGVTLIFKDALWLLQNTTFQQLWKHAVTGGSMATTPFSRCVLFMDINSWVPNVYQTVQWQLNEIITYAASCGIRIAAGTIDYNGWYINYYHCRAISCLEAILKCVEPLADAKIWIDGSTATPTLHIRSRAAIAALSAPSGTGPGPITLPYRGKDAAGRVHTGSKAFTPRYDLVPSQVVLQYQINNTVDGKPAIGYVNDVYPPGSTGQAPFALVVPIDLTGVNQVTQKGQLDCEPLACNTGSHAARRAWWASKRGGEQSKLADFRVRFGANTIGDAVILDDTGADITAYALANYPRRIVAGTHHDWMAYNFSPGVPTAITTIRAHVKVTVQFAEYPVAGSGEGDTSGNSTKKYNAHELHFSLTLTNAPAGVTEFKATLNDTSAAETPVNNLAQNIYTSRSVLDYDGDHEITDPGLPNGSPATPPLAQLIGHWNVLNFSGGASAWANANMTVAATDIDLMTNQIRITVGPAKHLQPQDWSSMLQFWRNRRQFMLTSARFSGDAGGGNNVTMAKASPDANTVEGLQVHSLQTVIAPDTDGTHTNLISHDAEAGQLFIGQLNTSDGSLA